MSLRAEDLAAPSRSCVHFAESGADLGELAAAGVAVRELGAESIDGPSELLAGLSEALEFPDYFGQNWDAANDCLRDLGWIASDQGWVLVIRGARGLWATAPEAAGALVESWIFCANEWFERDRAFHLVFEW